MLRYKYNSTANIATTPPPAPTLVLQRLLCPYLAPNTDPTSTTYNPYITVDYFELPPTGPGTPGVAGSPTGSSTGGINQAASHNGLVNQAGATTPLQVVQRQSFGRAQPYQAQVQPPFQTGVTGVQGVIAQTVQQSN